MEYHHKESNASSDRSLVVYQFVGVGSLWLLNTVIIIINIFNVA